MMLKWLISLVFILTMAIRIESQEYHIEKLTVEDGLPSNTIFDIIQDRDGMLWFASREGLNSYDGYEISTYQQPYGEKFKTKNTFSLLEDSEGNIWCGTWGNGIHIFNKQTLTFDRLSYKSDTTYSLLRIRTMLLDKKNNTWFIDVQNGLFCYDHITDSLHCYKQETDQISKDPLLSMTFNTDSTILIAFNKFNDCYILFNTNTKVASTLFPDYDKQIIYNAWEIASKDSMMYVATRGGGVFVFNQHNTNNHTTIGINHGISDIKIRTLTNDKKGGIWTGSPSGLYHINLSKNLQIESFKHFTSKTNSPHHLNSLSINTLFFDRSDNLWIGTDDGGVNKIAFNKIKFKGCNSSSHSGWTDGITYFFAPLNNGRMILGGHNHIIYDVNSDSVISPYNQKNDLSSVVFSNNFTSYSRVKKDNYFLHALVRDFHRIVFVKTDLSMQLLEPPIILISDSIVFVTQQVTSDKFGSFWLASLSGLTRFTPDYEALKYDWNIDNFTINQIKTINSTSKIPRIQCSYISSNNDLWIGTIEAGLLRTKYNPENKLIDSTNFEIYTIFNTPGLKSNSITTIYEDSKNTIWLGTAKGLTNYENGRFEYVFDSLNLNSFHVSAIEEDHKSNLWLSTDRGVIMFNNDKNKPKFRYFTKANGLTSNIFIKNSGYKSADGRIFFGNLNGFNWLDPKKIRYDSVPPKLRLKDVTVINKTLQSGTITYHPGQLAGKDIPEIELRHKDYGIRINFTALAYSNPQKNMYAYMLKGYDGSFIFENSSIRTAQYGLLPPGSYSFVLKAANADGFWCEPEILLHIHVIPPWWKTLWFKVVFLFICIGSIVLFFSLRLWVIKKRNAELEKKVQLRTRDLNKANQVLQMQAAELVEQKEEIFAQAEEISTQNDELRKQRDQINDKNEELIQHKENLENLVKKRTIQLETAKLKAEESDKLKTYFLANLSHEIRTPMNAINGFAELLSLSKKIPDSNKKHLHIIKHNALSLMKLIDDILDISMLEAKNLKLNIQTINIKEELRSFYNDFNCIYKSSNSNVDFRLALPAESVKIRFDLLRFQQILNHLLSNAFKYTVSGEVVFGYRMDNSAIIGNTKHIILFVSDTGNGIPYQQLPFIYDAFRQGTTNTETPDEGLGLGLSIVKGIVDLHNYSIQVKTEKGKGTEFSISIPVLS